VRKWLRSEGGKRAVECLTNNEIRMRNKSLRKRFFGSVLYAYGAIFALVFSMNQASEPTIFHQMDQCFVLVCLG
jgi:hypothetical protein